MVKRLVKKGHTFLFTNGSTLQTIFKNSFWLFLAEFVNKGLMFFLTILIARSLGAEGYGQFAFAMSFTALFAVLADFGLSTLTIREVARDNTLAKKYIDNIAVIKVFLSLITLILIFFIVQFMGKSSEVNMLVYLFGIYIVFNSFGEFFRSIFRAFEQMQYEAYTKIVQGLVLFGLGLWFLLNGYSSSFIVGAYVVGAFIGMLYSLYLVHGKFSRFWVDIDFKFWKEILRKALPLVFVAILIIIYFKIDTLMISFISGDQELGFYSASFNLIYPIMVFFGMYYASLFPIFSKIDKGKLKNILLNNAKIIILIGFILSLLLFVLAKYLVIFVYGIEYDKSVDIFKVFVLFFPLLLLNPLIGNFMRSVKLENMQFISSLIGVFINITLNLIFIPLYGGFGAAITTGITESFILLINSYFVIRFFRQDKFFVSK